MHVDFVEGDFERTIEAYQATVKLPEQYVVPDLSRWRIATNAVLAREDRGDGESVRVVLRKGKDGEASGQENMSFEDVVKACESGGNGRSLFEEHEVAIFKASIDATALVEKLKGGRWTCVQVVKAHLKRAAYLQQVCGPYTEIFFDAALKRAESLDRLGASQRGRLYGVSISIKAHISMQGTGSDRGFVFDVLQPEAKRALVDKLARDRAGEVEESVMALLRKQAEHMGDANAPMVDLLLKEGAIIIAKTRMPQSVMQLDTRSNLHGQTLNPLNLTLSPGGSSGGEAASVCAGASLAGIGTDIGGSVRQPAACCGLYGLRPTVGRLATAGTNSTMLGNEGIIGTAGPFARSARDLTALMSILANPANQVDPFLCPPIPWREGSETDLPRDRKLRVGVMLHDGYVEPITPIRRALAQAIKQLKNDSRIEVVLFEAGDAGKEAWRLARELYFMESGQLIKSLAKLTGEPLVPLTSYICQTDPVKNHSAAESWALQYARETFKRQFWRKFDFSEAAALAQRSTSSSPSTDHPPQGPKISEKIDVLLCPAGAQLAPRPGKIWYWGYTSLFNLVDLPGVVFPLRNSFADSKVDEEFERREVGRVQSDELLDRQNREEYEKNRATFDGAPVGLQLIGHRFQEERLLKSLTLIEDALNVH